MRPAGTSPVMGVSSENSSGVTRSGICVTVPRSSLLGILLVGVIVIVRSGVAVVVPLLDAEVETPGAGRVNSGDGLRSGVELHAAKNKKANITILYCNLTMFLEPSFYSQPNSANCGGWQEDHFSIVFDVLNLILRRWREQVGSQINFFDPAGVFQESQGGGG